MGLIKLRARLAMAFLTIATVPMLLFYLLVLTLSNYQARPSTKEYGLTEQVDLFSGNSMQIFNRITKHSQEGIRSTLDSNLGLYNDLSYLDKIDAELKSHYAYLIVRKGDTILYYGDSNKNAGEAICTQLPRFDIVKGDLQGGAYLNGESQHLIKQMDSTSPDGQEGGAFIISNVDDLTPEVKSMIREILVLGTTTLVFVDTMLTFWVYRSILSPPSKLQEVTEKTRDGSLDFTLDVDVDDETGQLCRDSEEMHIRLKEDIEDRIQYDRDNKELINNISHDLKIPVTAIKGYMEDILDGVASPSGKLDKYIRTTYNRSNDMDRLTDELTFYSKIDTNKIPYTFSKISVAQYFWDCVEEVSLDIEARGIELGYFNYADEDVIIIADAEQMKHIMNNIISNSVKYLNKERGTINVRIKDVGNLIQVGIENNGKGTVAKDLPNIFDRFYRTNSSRSSTQGGSGIGLSIVRRIVEDHGGRMWITSKERIGTEIHFVLRKYQEVLQDEQDSSRKR